MKKVLIVGASSCLGSNLAVYLRDHYSVFGTYANNPFHLENIPSFRFVMQEGAPIRKFVELVKPDAIVYCAAETNLKTCIEKPNYAHFINAEAACTFANAAEIIGARFIYFSSSKVFSGKKGGYTENDKPDPVEHYGLSKQRGEELVGRFSNSLIIRLGTVFALGGLNQRSFLGDLLRRLWAGKTTPAVNDEFRSFVGVQELNTLVGTLIDAEQPDSQIFHLGSEEKLSHYQFAEMICSQFGLSRELLQPVSGKDFHSKGSARQPDLHLVSQVLGPSFFVSPQPTENGIKQLHSKLVGGTH